ncbi:1,4-dihydroxy-2-naphthoate phytyltransferase [Ostreococcus tauri]|uniref:1,4-dihydroxy-2-naphthoate phytyltransferase n=1 Tax=Ostreococcus tauri TaxID=70448 RepID=A0A096PBX2_OSTTA|nr:1,4-dihydroxy-2-naphthoate phytyltransferase [Ostreococcus tauri]CEG02143.1 1,4-dihydroxy-2-naphthoate phytyltransferase [Ostreococcus tauri]|eukprot:XP_022841370.1 1,4-dihydroxy-2-naphthoate phytyltransferase [Ostreococcus tauri]
MPGAVLMSAGVDARSVRAAIARAMAPRRRRMGMVMNARRRDAGAAREGRAWRRARVDARWTRDGVRRTRMPGRARAVRGVEGGSGAGDGVDAAELWRRAAKIPMYSVAWIPIACAASLVFCQYGKVDVKHLGALALGATAVVAWLNLSNDAFDATTNVDARKPESVVALLGGNASIVHAMAVVALVSGCGLLWGAARGASGVAWKALAAAIAMGYAYQGPPFRLSYKGLGEPICFLAFGPLATTAFYLMMSSRVAAATSAVPAIVWSCGVLIGLTTAFILFTSHFHQEEGDRAAGKLSPVVRMGLPGALLVADNLIGAHYATVATLAAAGWLPYTAVFGLIITYPLARHIVDQAQSTADAGAISDLFFTKYLAVRFHVIHGLALALGVCAQRAYLNPNLFFPA